MRNDNSFLALLSGVAIGAIAGLLLAPDKGSETYKRVKETARNLSDKLQDQYEEGKEELNKQAENVKSQAKDVSEKAESQFSKAKDKAESDLNKAQEKAQKEFSSIQNKGNQPTNRNI